MQLIINKEIFEKFPGLNIGVVTAKGIDNTGENEEITQLLRSAEAQIKPKFDTKTISQEPKMASWRQAYSSFGAKPKKNKCSVENLYRMVLNGIELRHINKIVVLYNYISLKYMVPVGGDNTDKVDGNIELRFAKGNEPFTELNSEETTNPREGEVVYADEKEVLCRRWNWRECDKSKMTEDMKNAAIVIEGLPPVTQDEIKTIADELAQLIEKYCGGSATVHVLNSENPAVDL
jgi:lysyl-tRNA synthetase class 2